MEIPFQNDVIDLQPTKIVAFAKNYSAHAVEMEEEVPDRPYLFLKPPSSLVGNGGVVVLPKASSRVDYEVELGVVVGERCKDVSVSEALEYVMGYSVFLDITARDIQVEDRREGMPWSVSKGFDTFSPLGPVIVEGGGLDPNKADIWLKVNGEVRQEGNTEEMLNSLEELISYASSVMTLEPMDVLATGTPSGIGALRDGDVMEAGVEGIGVLNLTAKRQK